MLERRTDVVADGDVVQGRPPVVAREEHGAAERHNLLQRRCRRQGVAMAVLVKEALHQRRVRHPFGGGSNALYVVFGCSHGGQSALANKGKHYFSVCARSGPHFIRFSSRSASVVHRSAHDWD